MQFKHPELLYALFVLLIPILVHLFQLRKFKKVPFTNVAFLKKINIQTRKSNTIKRWLVLFTRMAALAMLVLAFAQPYRTTSDTATKPKETVIYLDNSFSMQAKGSNGPLLKQSVQDLITNIPEDKPVTIITNDNTFNKSSVKELRNTLLSLTYTANQLTATEIDLKAQKAFSKDENTDKRLIYISDLQDKNDGAIAANEIYSTHIVQLTPEVINNITIDSITAQTSSGKVSLTATLRATQQQEDNVSVSLFNGEQLAAKGTVSFDDALETTIDFDIKPEGNFEGKLVINDPYLTFDNTLFFNLNTTVPVRVLSINEAEDTFLTKVFRQPEFDYNGVPLKTLDYSIITDQNLVVLNEVQQPSMALINALSAFAKAGGSILIIPPVTLTAQDYNNLLNRISPIIVNDTFEKQKLVTTINYDHPLYNDVFESKIKNFQYPSVSQGITLQGGDSLLSYADGTTFLSGQNNIYIFSAPLNTLNSNFQNSPLIVPTLYNIGKQSLSLPALYFTAGRDNIYDVPVRLGEDVVLSLSAINTGDNNFIPLQQTFGNKVRITTTDILTEAGIYNIKRQDSTVQQVSYNYDRSESLLRYKRIDAQDGVSYASSVTSLFDTLKAKDNVHLLWKWFVIFAIGFLLLEMLFLKFLK